ncbi:MAG: glycerophosphodiester phosphodiesterase family protein [Pseudolabrys sp.]|jgi:glycerophosphoryl diester phosphodiesterase
MPGLHWLTARPIAHRGLHDSAAGIVENTASAFTAAMAGRYGIECDVQISADGEAMVHHDDALGRLTEGGGALASLPTAALQQVPFKATADRILTLPELCELAAGRVPLVIELKSRFDGDSRLARRVAEVLAGYQGPAAVMSFDPAPIAALRAVAPHLTRGIVAERHYTHPEWAALLPATRRSLTFLLHAPHSRPNFIAYSVKDLPALPPLVARHLFGLPLLTWTVRSTDDRATAARYADQMIFEGFRPP